MPIKFNMVRGRPGRLLLRHIGNSLVAPTPVTVTLSSNAPQGDNTLVVTALAADIPLNTILEFSRAAGDPDTIEVVTSADASSGETTLLVEAYDGAKGDGISESLAIGDAAIWDGLYTDIASQNLNFAKNAQSSELAPVTHGSGSGVTISRPEVTSMAPSIPRDGLFFAGSPLIKDIVRYGDTNSNWWAKYQVPDETGRPYLTYEGLAVVQGVGHPTPADDLVQLTYEVRFVEEPAVTFADEQQGS